ncbi:MAG: iron-containing alcohol dehydrogenase, partial [Clostridia bacterium]|nr:iron-containing alcohol dehydrogenase [Clostridia bacterium]
DMIKSGYGDILGKFSCLNDWKLAHAVNDEYICEYVYDLTYSMLSATKDLGAKLLSRDEEAVGILMEALVGVGIAMAYVGNSRPASGSEHHMSHFFEVIGIMKDEPYFMHGTDVAFSAVYTQKMREELMNIEEPVLKNPFDKESWEKKIREVYFDAAEGVIALQNKLGWYEEDKISIYKERWSEIKNVLADTPSSAELKAYLESIELDIAEFDKLYGEEKINNAIRYAKDLKDRYTVLWMHNALC